MYAIRSYYEPILSVLGAGTVMVRQLGGEERKVEISGRVPGMARSDYRAITEEVQRFAEALGADSYNFV